MKTIPVLLLGFCFLTTPVSSQDEKRNSLGLNLMLLPIKVDPYKATFPYVEYMRFFNDHAAIVARLSYLTSREEESSFDYYYREKNFGPGLGAGFRWHFGQRMNGFFVGAAVDILAMKWETEESFSADDSGTAVAIAPNVQFGGRFNLGAKAFLTPSLILGGYISGNSAGGSEASVFGFPSVVLGFKF
jgi:hypothetical protein